MSGENAEAPFEVIAQQVDSDAGDAACVYDRDAGVAIDGGVGWFRVDQVHLVDAQDGRRPADLSNNQVAVYEPGFEGRLCRGCHDDKHVDVSGEHLFASASHGGPAELGCPGGDGGHDGVVAVGLDEDAISRGKDSTLALDEALVHAAEPLSSVKLDKCEDAVRG